ncbi:unnamed protein product [Schistocephalus solidus]|uniref:Intraflagellar transport protein 43 homolog n=1 Tax=Schistocephalus solidus TaxID=70667 RepID=A0A183TCA1_SCHSO|nr:unnamed protein product [Schistocephalus solidus]
MHVERDLESTRSPPQHQTQDVQSCHIADAAVSSGAMGDLPKAGVEAQPLPPQLPSQNTKSYMARQDTRHESIGTNRPSQHLCSAETTAIALEWPWVLVDIEVKYVENSEDLPEATADQPGDLGGPRPEPTGMEKIREEWFSNL